MNEKKELFRKIQAADFAAYDLLLYLDTHPCCQSALALFKEKCEEAKRLRYEYEKTYGPITPCASSGETPWQWIKNPWTWEKSE